LTLPGLAVLLSIILLEIRYPGIDPVALDLPGPIDIRWYGLMYLVGFRNRVVVLVDWAWSYVTWQRGARLITDLHQGFRRSYGAARVHQAWRPGHHEFYTCAGNQLQAAPAAHPWPGRRGAWHKSIW
jgi:hypothetical protein